jgi:hypothetical protein
VRVVSLLQRLHAMPGSTECDDVISYFKEASLASKQVATWTRLHASRSRDQVDLARACVKEL